MTNASEIKSSMTEQMLVDYVKANKVALVNTVLESLRNESDVPTLVIMAGYPGSGKTEYIKSSATLKLLPTLDLDDLVSLLPGYIPEEYYRYRKAGGRLLAACFEEAINRKISFILEGTFSSEISILNIERALKREYSVQIIRLTTNADQSWQYAMVRKIISKRPTERSGFGVTVKNVDIMYNRAKIEFQDAKNVTFMEVTNERRADR
jgi:predicted ABC-type ATPase